MQLVFEKLESENKEKIAEMSDFAGKIFFDYYNPILPEGQASYMISRFLSVSAIEEKLSESHQPKVLFEFVKDSETDEKLGFASYWIQKDENSKDECYLDKFYLSEASRGKGMGKMILDHLKIFCKENNLPHITLNVNKYNKTVQIYEKLGFKNIRSEVNDIGNGYVMDDYVMRLEIN